MARIPRMTDSRRVQQRGLPDGSINPATPAGTFGPDLGPAADQLSQIALRAADRANTARVMEADNALSEFENTTLYDPETGALNTRGSNAFGLPDTVMQSYDQRVAEIRDGLVGAQRSAFDRLAAQRRRSVDSTIQRHVHNQISTYEREQADALITNSQTTAVNNYNDDERVGVELRRQRGAIMARAQDMGWSEEQAQAVVQQAESTTLAQVLSRHAESDPYAARERFAAIEDRMTPNERSATRNRIETEIRRREAEARARRAEQRQIQAIARAELSGRAQDAMAAYAAGLEFDNPPTREEFVAAYGDEAEDRFTTFRRYQELQPSLQDLAMSSPEEAREILQGFNPAPDGVAGEDFRERQEIAEIARRSYESMVAQQEDDPALYVMRHSPAVQRMLQDGQTTIEDFATGLIAEQQRLGITRPRLLTEQRKAEIVSGFSGTEDGGDNAAQLLSGLQGEWGRHWPTVFRQLQDELPNAALVIGTGVDGATASRLARIANIPTEDLRKGLESTVTRDVTDELNDRFADFRVTLQNQAGGERTFAALYEEAQRLSLSYAAEGDSARDAADRAFSSLVDERYTVNGTYRVPKDIDADLVERGAEAALESIDPEQLQYERQEWMDEEFAAQQIRNVLRDSAYWVTDPDESGLVLYVNGEAVLDRDGDPVTRSWADLSTQAEEQEPGLWERFQEGRRSLRGVQRETAPQSWGSVE